MQRTYVAIAMALYMTCAFAAVNSTNYVKAPVQVVADNETSFTNTPGTTLSLQSATVGDLYVVSQLYTTSNTTWSVWLKKLDVKALSSTQNSSLTFVNPNPTSIEFYNNYILAFNVETDTSNVSALRVYQQSLTGGAALTKLTLSTNTSATFNVSYIQSVKIGKTIYVFYLAADKKVNVTNFALGGSVGTNEFTLTSTYDSGSLQTVWGESLSSSQVFAAWNETGVFKDSVVDLSKGTATPTPVGGLISNSNCFVYATDKKWYGELCYVADTVNFNASTNYTIRTNTSSVAAFRSTTPNLAFDSVYPYGPYLAIFYKDSRTTAGITSYSYDIWNLDTLTAFKNNTQYLTNDGKSIVSWGNIQAGGIYTLTYNVNTATATVNAFSSISVGLVLGSSYLATILGFLFTIVAGLFLF